MNNIPQTCLESGFSLGEVFDQGFVEGHTGIKRDVVGAHGLAGGAEFVSHFLQGLQIFGATAVGIHNLMVL